MPERAKPRSGGVEAAGDGDDAIDAHVGYLLERRRGLTLVCWRCKRRAVLTADQVAAGATKGPAEEIWHFAHRCRCTGCGAGGPRFRYEGEPRPMLHGRTYTQRGTLPFGAE